MASLPGKLLGWEGDAAAAPAAAAGGSGKPPPREPADEQPSIGNV